MASYDEAIPPGQAGKITATVKTEGARGHIEKSITVTSNDDSRGPVNLRLKADIVGSVEFLPRAGLLFPAGAQWEWSSRLLVRKDETEKGDLKISDVSANVPWIKATATEVKEPMPAAEGLPMAFPGDWLLNVEVTDEAPKVQGGYQVKFKTGLTREPETTLPVSVVLQHPMRAVPNSLMLQAPPAGGEVSGTVTVSLRPGLGKETPTATVSPEAFTVKLEPAGPRKYTARVTWHPDPKAPESTPRQGMVTLKVSDGQLPIQVRVADAPTAVAPAPAPASAAAANR